jgi:hypothetical protein
MTEYFPHDYHSFNDSRIKIIVRRHGGIAYAVFWRVVEEMHISDSLLAVDQVFYEALAIDLMTEINSAKEIIKSCIEVGLFYLKDDRLGSNRVDRNKERRSEISEKRSQAAKSRYIRSVEPVSATRKIEISAPTNGQMVTAAYKVAPAANNDQGTGGNGGLQLQASASNGEQIPPNKKKENNSKEEDIPPNAVSTNNNKRTREQKINEILTSHNPEIDGAVDMFADLLYENMPNIFSGLQKNYKEKWRVSIADLILQGKDIEEIKTVIHHCFDKEKSWWARTKNIRSPAKLLARTKGGDGVLIYQVLLEEIDDGRKPKPGNKRYIPSAGKQPAATGTVKPGTW